MPNDADILAYANGFFRRYGELAAPYARDYADKLRNCGDDDGHNVWMRVAEMIEDGEARSLAA